MALKHVSDAEVNSGCVMQAFPHSDRHALSFTPSTRHLSGWFAMAFDSASQRPGWFNQSLLRWCAAAVSFQRRAVSGSWAAQSKLSVWKSWDCFVRLFCPICPSCYLIAGKRGLGWGFRELDFARSDTGSFIEAVSRSAQRRRTRSSRSLCS